MLIDYGQSSAVAMLSEAAVDQSTSRVLHDIEMRLPDISGLEPSLSVPFAPQNFPEAKLVWLNQRWLLEQGIEVWDGSVLADVTDTLLANYAGNGRMNASSDRVLMADRYGTSVGARNGGSGRCGYYGGFNAKGVGRTPLVSAKSDWSYANGFMFLGEAIREALLGELLSEELPFGAVPVIAIIDTGEDAVASKDGSLVERRAIVVRPNFLRPSHAERSIFFGTGGTPISEQYLDAMRVRTVVSTLCDEKVCAERRLGFSGLGEMFRRFGRQIGASWANRLWLGRFLTSNVAIDGAIVDFGACRTAPSWRRAVADVGQEFGTEMDSLMAAAISLVLHFDKYAPENYAIQLPFDLISKAREAASESFRESCMAALGLHASIAPDALELAEALLNYFKRLQAEHVEVDRIRVRPEQAWLFQALAPDHTPAQGEDVRHIKRLLENISTTCGLPNEALRVKARMWLTPRTHLYYENASRVLSWIGRRAGASDWRNYDIGALVRGYLSKVRQPRDIPQWLLPRAQVALDAGFAVFGVDVRTGVPSLWLEGTVCGDNAQLLSKTFSVDALGRYGAVRRNNRVHIVFPLSSREIPPKIEICSREASLPRVNEWYQIKG